jgi:tetratricopeptide (TPR) repeat protein
MARASAKRGKRPRPNARARERATERVAAAQPQQKQQEPRKKKKVESYEDTLFFNRLRRRAKWVFVLLAVAFFIGFVAFGVGAGGTGIGDAIQDFFGAGSSAPSAEEAQEKVDENPNDPDALLELATALQSESRNLEAAEALERYVELRPDDVDVLGRLAGAYQTEAFKAERRADELFQRAFGESSLSTFIFTFPASSGFLGAVGEDPVATAISGDAGVEAQDAQEEARLLFEKQVPVYEKLTTLQPNEPTHWLGLGASAVAAGEDAKAIDALETFLERFPEHPAVPDIENQLEALRADDDVLTG